MRLQHPRNQRPPLGTRDGRTRRHRPEAGLRLHHVSMRQKSGGSVAQELRPVREVRLFPKARTIIDVGAEEARAVKCDERGVMADFVVNERCAAGAGTFIEAMARALELRMEDMGPLLCIHSSIFSILCHLMQNL